MIIVALDTAVGDAEAAWASALAYLAQKFAAIRPLDVAALPHDRAEAMGALDTWAAGDRGWRRELTRFYEAHAPVLLHPDPTLNAALRSARRSGVSLTLVSPLPRAAVDLYIAHLGLGRSIEAVRAEGDAVPDGLLKTRRELDAALGIAR